jgi:hypothetical protein
LILKGLPKLAWVVLYN